MAGAVFTLDGFNLFCLCVFMPEPSPARQHASLLANLQGHDLQDLRRTWAQLYGPAPKLRSPDLLRQLIAWRLQAEAEPAAAERLRERLERDRAVAPATRVLGAGARVMREWKGEVHEAEVLADGRVLHRGRTYDSLSAVARQITGARWNGPRFFGLRGARP